MPIDTLSFNNYDDTDTSRFSAAYLIWHAGVAINQQYNTNSWSINNIDYVRDAFSEHFLYADSIVYTASFKASPKV